MPGPSGLRSAAAVIVLAALVCALQIFSGAYRADFDSSTDEPAHVVSSLMVRDYLVSSSLAHPWEFAKTYYIHYPKVAILHWPPLFHMTEAVWMLGAGRSRIGLLSLQAAIGSAFAAGIFFVILREYGFWIGLLSAGVFATTRLVQTSGGMVTPDLLLGFLVFLATVLYAFYWDRGGGRWGWGVALLSIAAIGTHGRGAAFLMVPVLAPLLLRSVTKTRVVLALVVMLAFVTLPPLLGQAYHSSPATVFANAREYFMQLGVSMEWPIVALAITGAVVTLVSRQRNTFVTVTIALALSCWVFHSLVNVPLVDYFLITTVPAVIVLAAAGAGALIRRATTSLERHAIAAVLAALALGTAVYNVATLPVKRSIGARRLTEQSALYRDSSKIWLVAGNSTFEGALIAETALRDRAEDHVVLRASKMLARSTWNGSNYRLRFPDASSVSTFLDEAHVDWVIARFQKEIPHVEQLEANLRANPARWQAVGLLDSQYGITAFKRVGPFPPGPPKIEIDMKNKVGSSFRFPE